MPHDWVAILFTWLTPIMKDTNAIVSAKAFDVLCCVVTLFEQDSFPKNIYFELCEVILDHVTDVKSSAKTLMTELTPLLSRQGDMITWSQIMFKLGQIHKNPRVIAYVFEWLEAEVLPHPDIVTELTKPIMQYTKSALLHSTASVKTVAIRFVGAMYEILGPNIHNYLTSLPPVTVKVCVLLFSNLF